jgi:hypothetical protein
VEAEPDLQVGGGRRAKSMTVSVGPTATASVESWTLTVPSIDRREVARLDTSVGVLERAIDVQHGGQLEAVRTSWCTELKLNQLLAPSGRCPVAVSTRLKV